jgi:hypothetical protein
MRHMSVTNGGHRGATGEGLSESMATNADSTHEEHTNSPDADRASEEGVTLPSSEPIAAQVATAPTMRAATSMGSKSQALIDVASQQHAAQRIDALRVWRGRKQRQSHAGRFVGAIADTARRAQRETGGFAAAWQSCADPAIVKQTRIASFRGGVATVVTHNAALRWVIDRDLRGGLLAQLRAACPAAITAVRVRSGSLIVRSNAK